MASNNPASSSHQQQQHSPYSDPEASSSGGFPDLDEDMPRRGESKRKRFHPFRAVRNIFRRNKRQGVDEETGASKKSRSTSELSTVHVPGDDAQTFEILAPPYAAGLSVSHDSIFSPEHGSSALDNDNAQPMPASALSVQHVAGLKRFQDELFTRVRARRDSDDEDIGLPHSPCTSPTTADVLAQGLKDKPCHSRSSYSAGSLISMGSSENDEDSGGVMSSNHSSRISLSDRRTHDFDGELGDVSQPVPLNHNAALHKISVRPKRTHGLPRHRKLQQIAAAAVATLPATPEVTEDQLGLRTPSTHSEEDRNAVASVEEKVLNTDREIVMDEEPIYDEVDIEDVPVEEEKKESNLQVQETPKASSAPSTPEPLVIPLQMEEPTLTEEPKSLPEVQVPKPETLEAGPIPKAPSPLRKPLPPKPVSPTIVTEPIVEKPTPVAIQSEESIIPDIDSNGNTLEHREQFASLGPVPSREATSLTPDPETSRGATPVSLEGARITSKSKSTAAELKLRHEIKQFSKRQKEMKEEMAKMKSEDEDLDIIDVKDCTKSLETITREKGSKTPDKVDDTAIEEDMTVVSAERFFTPIDRPSRQTENKVYKPVSQKAEIETKISLVQEEEPKPMKSASRGHVFTVNDVSHAPAIPVEEKFTSMVLVSNTNDDDQRTEMSVISSSDLSQRIPVERPPRKKHEAMENKNRVTSGLVTVESQSFSNYSTLKIEDDSEITVTTSPEPSPTAKNPEVSLEKAEDAKTEDTKEDGPVIVETTPKATENEPGETKLVEDAKESDKEISSKERKEQNELIRRDGSVEEPAIAQDVTKDRKQLREASLKKEVKEPEPAEESEKAAKVVMRKHGEAKQINRGSAEASNFTSLDFECIMKQRRSITENDVVAQKVVADEAPRTPEASKGNNGKRLSVEIVPYNTRVKESNYTPSTPSKSIPSPLVADTEPEKETKPIETPVEIRRKLSFKAENSANNEDLTKHPVQFRIRRGKSLNEKTDALKDVVSPEKPKIARPKSQQGPLVSKEKPALGDKPGVPEFMKIQLRSSKEELDSIKSEPAITSASPGTGSPGAGGTGSPKTNSPIPQWEVKIGQPKFQRQQSVSLPQGLPASDSKTNSPENTGKKKDERPKEKLPERVAPVTTAHDKAEKVEKPQRMDSNVENKENMGSSNVLVKDDVKNEDLINGKETEESKFSRSSLSGDVRRVSQSLTGGLGTDAEPELFRVFARRSIKQRNPDKNKQQSNKEEEDVGSLKTAEGEPSQAPSGPTKTEANEIKAVAEKPPPWKAGNVAKPRTVEKTKDASREDDKTKKDPAVGKDGKEVQNAADKERSNSPQRPKFRAKSVLLNESPIAPRERKTSMPTDMSSPKILTDNKKPFSLGETRDVNAKNNKTTNPPQVTVSIKPQQESSLVRKSSVPSNPKSSSPVSSPPIRSSQPSSVPAVNKNSGGSTPPIIKNPAPSNPIVIKNSTPATPANNRNSQPDIMDPSNGSPNNKDGSTPTWMQLAQQRREQREQKERKLYGSSANSFVLDSNNAVRPSRNSKVLDLVNNFQKLQTT